MPVVATGLAGGRTGTRIVEELTSEAILNDFVRIDDESRTSTAVVDPTGSSYTEINEWGPQVQPEELETLLEKLAYLSRGADYVVFAGSLPRAIDDGFYAEAVRELNRRGAQTVLDSEGEPLRLGAQAEPLLVSPNEREAEQLVGQEFHDDDDFLVGARHHRRARRAQRPDHARVGLLGAPSLRARDDAVSGRLLRGSTRSRRSARATCSWPVSSRRGSTAAPTRRLFAAPSRPERPRRSSSAPGASSPARPDGWWAASKSPSWSR